MAAGELEGVEQLRLGERADQEMGGAMLVEGLERRRVGARQQHQQGRRIGLGRVGDRPHRLLPLGERAARVDHRHRRPRGDEPRLGIVRPPRRDRLPAGALGEPGKLVAMAEGEDEERRPHRARLAARDAAANRFANGVPGLAH